MEQPSTTAKPLVSPSVHAEHVRQDAPALMPLLELHPDLLVYTRLNPHFNDVRSLYNLKISTLPLAVIRPQTEQELVSAVEFCSKNNVPMSVRGGGHDMPGRSLISGGVVMDTRALASVNVIQNIDSGLATHAVVRCGTIAEQVDNTLDALGLVTPLGWCSWVGYIGWAAGGGYGVLGSYHGMGVDQILGGRIVTPNGTIVDTDDDPDLLWALRGAGLGNFGVILDLRVKVYPRPRVLAGFVAFPLSEGRSVFASYEKLREEDYPDRLSGDASIGMTEGGPAIMLYFHWILDGENTQDAEGWLAKFRSLGTVLMDTVVESKLPHPPGSINVLLVTLAHNRGKATTSEFLKYISKALQLQGNFSFDSVAISGFLPELLDVLDKYPVPKTGGIIIHQAQGLVLSSDVDAAFAMRERHLILGISAVLLDEADSRTLTWSGDVNRELRSRKVVLDQGYWSFTQPEFCDAVLFFGEERTRKLQMLKEKYNPGNAFPQAYPLLE